MAEAVLCIVAGPPGFGSLLSQVISGIRALHGIKNRADKAPAELASLISELTTLQRLMEDVRDKILPSRCNDSLFQQCHESCEHVVRGLEKLKKRVPTESEATEKQKVLKIFAFRHWKEDVESLRRHIQDAKTNLIL